MGRLLTFGVLLLFVGCGGEEQPAGPSDFIAGGGETLRFYCNVDLTIYGDCAQPPPIGARGVTKTFRGGDFQDYMPFEFAFTSNLDSPVRAFTGVVVLQDLFERDIMRVTVTVEEPLQPGGTVTYEGGIEYNQFMDSHKQLRSIARSDLITTFELETVIFQDETRESFGDGN